MVEPLSGLEKSFRPLVENLEPELEPVTMPHPEDEE